MKSLYSEGRAAIHILCALSFEIIPETGHAMQAEGLLSVRVKDTQTSIVIFSCVAPPVDALLQLRGWLESSCYDWITRDYPAPEDIDEYLEEKGLRDVIRRGQPEGGEA